MADTVYRVLTVYDADTKGAQTGVGGLAIAMDHALNLLERGKEMIAHVIHLHSEAENATIAIAGLLSAGDMPGAKNFQTAMGMSAEIIKQMRKDARDLPGEFEDLQSIFQFSILGGSQAGKSVQEIEQMSAQMMSVTKALGIRSEFAGREFAELMEGRASSRITLFAKLKNLMGDAHMDAAKFNALSAPEKWEKIQKALSSFGPMIGEYSKSWDAVSSTTADYLRNIIRIGSAGVFEGLKGTLQGLNAWYEKNEQQILAVSGAVFDVFGAAIRFVADTVATVAPFVYEFFRGIVEVGSVAFGVLKEAVLSAGEMLGPWFGGHAETTKDVLFQMGEIVGNLVLGYGILQVATGALAAAQWAWNAAMGANPIGLMVAAVAALAAGMLVVIAYFDELTNGLAGLYDNKATRWLLKKAGVIPESATDEDIDAAMGGMRRDHEAQAKARVAELDQKFGSHGIMARLGFLGERPGLAKDPMGPENESPIARLLRVSKTPTAHKPEMNVNVQIVQTINEAEDGKRVLDMTKKALRDSLERPIQSYTASVYR